MANEKNDYRGVWLAQPYVLAGYLSLSLGAFLGLAFAFWCGFDFSKCCGAPSPERLATAKLIAYAFCFGGIGGTCYSIYGLYQHVAAGDYDHAYLYWYLFRGPLGAVLGMMSYLLMQGGILIFSDANLEKVVSSPPSSFKSKAAISALAFLAGYSANQFADKLQDLSRTLFGKDSHKEKTHFKAKEKNDKTSDGGETHQRRIS